MSRVDSARLAVEQGRPGAVRRRRLRLRRVLPVPRRRSRRVPRPASSAFVQPGGSMRDAEVIAAADAAGAAMVLTGIRHFRH